MARDKRANQVYRNIRKSKAAKTTLEHKSQSYPISGEGVQGTIQVRETPDGLELLCRSRTGQWYSTPLRKLNDTLRVSYGLDVEGTINTNEGLSIKNKKIKPDSDDINVLENYAEKHLLNDGETELSTPTVIRLRYSGDNDDKEIHYYGNETEEDNNDYSGSAKAQMNELLPNIGTDWYLDQTELYPSKNHYLWFRKDENTAYRVTLVPTDFTPIDEPTPDPPNPEIDFVLIVKGTAGSSEQYKSHKKRHIPGVNFDTSGLGSGAHTVESIFAKVFFNSDVILPLDTDVGGSEPGVMTGKIQKYLTTSWADITGEINIDTTNSTYIGSSLQEVWSATGKTVDSASESVVSGSRLRISVNPDQSDGTANADGGYELDSTKTKTITTFAPCLLYGRMDGTSYWDNSSGPTDAEVIAGMTLAYGTCTNGNVEDPNYAATSNSGWLFPGSQESTSNDYGVTAGEWSSAFNNTYGNDNPFITTSASGLQHLFIAYKHTDTLEDIIIDGVSYIDSFRQGTLAWTNPAGISETYTFYTTKFGTTIGVSLPWTTIHFPD